MSYDLYFAHKPDAQPPARTQLESYFSQRPYYTLDENDIRYENKYTGVHFSFSFSETDTEETDDDWQPNPLNIPLSFNINYCRPHFFGLEAADELETFTTHFNLDVEDTGALLGQFDKALFYQEWSRGNEFGYRVAVSDGRPEINLPTKTLQETWEWNYTRDKRQQELGDGIFVPQIIFSRINDRVCSFVVWPDAIPILLPRVDYVFLFRKELAPRHFFIRREDKTLVPFSALETLLIPFDRGLLPMPHYRLAYQKPAQTVVNFFKHAEPGHLVKNLLGPNEIYNQELLDEAEKNKLDLDL